MALNQALANSRHPAHKQATFAEINRHYLADEAESVRQLIQIARIGPEQEAVIESTAKTLVEAVRNESPAVIVLRTESLNLLPENNQSGS